MKDGRWFTIEFLKWPPTIYVNGLLYRDPSRSRLFNAWLRWTFRFRRWRAFRHARG